MKLPDIHFVASCSTSLCLLPGLAVGVEVDLVLLPAAGAEQVVVVGRPQEAAAGGRHRTDTDRFDREWSLKGIKVSIY